jgi:5'-nucleotidase / UDP-sugar diphosphatase
MARRHLAAAIVLVATLWTPTGLGAPVAGAAPEGHGQAQELLVTFLHTSDEHSTVLPSPLSRLGSDGEQAAQGGFARLATVVSEVRAAKAAVGEPVLLTSAGDYTGGSPFSWLALYGGAPELTLMVEIGYDVISLGNHEFDFGPEALARTLAVADQHGAGERTAILATNTRPPPGHPLEGSGLRSSHLVVLPNGLKVGFLGLIGREAARVAPAASPVEITEPTEAAAAAAADLRSAGAHIVVAVTHAGLNEDRELARAVPEIDLILGGHDHRLLEAPVLEAGTPIVHPGSHLRQVALVEVGYDPATGAVRLRGSETGSPSLLPLDASVPEHPHIAARIDELREELEGRVAELTEGRFSSLHQPVMSAGFRVSAGPPRAESPLGNFVTDAMRAAVEAATGERCDFAVQADGVIRGDLIPGDFPGRAGVITFHDFAASLGMGSGADGLPGYPLVAFWLTGGEVRRALEISTLLSGLMGPSYFLQVSGLRAELDPRRAVWARLPLRGTPIPTGRAVMTLERDLEGGARDPVSRRDSRLYHVATDHYVASFLPMVGELVPRLAIEPKDRHGEPLASIDEAIVRREGRELKVWQAVLEHAVAQPQGPDGIPRLPATYAQPAGRLSEVAAPSPWRWPLALLISLAVVGLMAHRWARS